MSATVANPGITDVPPPRFQPLPDVTPDLFVIHYSASPDAPRAGRQTPPVSAVVVQNVLSGTRMTFAALTEAEARGIPPAEMPARSLALERDMLRTFAAYADGHARGVWVHWGMRDALFGFDVLARRARALRQRAHAIRADRRFDLAHHLARRFGEDFAPHPQLWHAARRNRCAGPDLLTDEETAAAWREGDHGADLRSLNAKVDAIARLFERVRTGQFLTGPGEASAPVADLPPAGSASPTDPALFRRAPLTEVVGVAAASPRAFDPARLTTRQWNILEELFRFSAFDRDTCQATSEVAAAVDGRGARPTSFKQPITHLRRCGLVDTAEGRSGGVWLTPEGRGLAELRVAGAAVHSESVG